MYPMYNISPLCNIDFFFQICISWCFSALCMPCRGSAVHIPRTISAVSPIYVHFQLFMYNVVFQLPIFNVKFQQSFSCTSSALCTTCTFQQTLHYVLFQPSIHCTVSALVTLRAVSTTHPISCLNDLFSVYSFNRPCHVMFQPSA